MKTNMMCRVARLMAAVRGGDERDAARAPETRTGHVARCADCQAYFRGATQLEVALRREAVGAAPSGARDVVPAGLEAGILRAVREARRDSVEAAVAKEQAAVTWWRPVVTFGTMAAVLAAGAFVYQRGMAPGGGLRGENVAATRADAQAIVTVVSDASERLMEEVLPKTGTLIAQNPLQNEAEAVVADARAVVDFLALNFLPGTRVAAK